MKKINVLDVKQALRDSRFRETLPQELSADVQKYLQNPNCSCNMPIYKKVLTVGAKQLIEYFPGREVSKPEEEDKQLAENHWTVINCNVADLQKELKRLPPGRKQLAISRYEDQVTVVVNEIMTF